MSRARTWIFYSTIVMIFSGAFYHHFGTFRFQAFYVVMFLNFGIMLLMKRLWAPKGLTIFLGFLLCSGALGIIRHTDTVGAFEKEMLAVGAYAFYMCSFYRTIDFKLEEAFRFYAKMAYWTQILGFVLYPIQYNSVASNRYYGIMQEPSIVAYLCLPALYYYADCWQKRREHGREVIVLLLAFILAQSGTGFTGLLFGAFIFVTRYRRSIVLAPITLFLVTLFLYEASPPFQERLDDTFKVLQTNDANGINLSTYTLFSNFHVMLEVLKEHPIMGNGFGSHGESFQKYIGAIDTGGFAGSWYEYENFEDACSFGIRVGSDFGLLGILLIFWFIWRFRPKGTLEIDVMHTALCLYFFVKIIRSGVYFDEEMYFYSCFYALAPMVVRMRSQRLAQTSPQFVPSYQFGHLETIK